MVWPHQRSAGRNAAIAPYAASGCGWGRGGWERGRGRLTAHAVGLAASSSISANRCALSSLASSAATSFAAARAPRLTSIGSASAAGAAARPRRPAAKAPPRRVTIRQAAKLAGVSYQVPREEQVARVPIGSLLAGPRTIPDAQLRRLPGHDGGVYCVVHAAPTPH